MKVRHKSQEGYEMRGERYELCVILHKPTSFSCFPRILGHQETHIAIRGTHLR